jgi:cholesterol transport system auxiliary component
VKHALAVLTLLLAACSGGLRSNAPASQTYVLRVTGTPPTPAAARAAGPSLRIERPSAAPGLRSERIVIMQPDHRMSYYAGSQWAAELPQVIQELAVERLRASGEWSSVVDSESAFASEYFLQITIRRFEADYTTDAAPTAWVTLDCAIGRRADHLLLAGFTAQGSASASTNRMSAVVAAFEAAANAALSEVAAGSAATLKSPPAPSSP